MADTKELNDQFSRVEKAFSKQSLCFDAIEQTNKLHAYIRKRVRNHVEPYLTKPTTILELNAGTGIDSFYFAARGHSVTATDLSPGMINELNKKITVDSISNVIAIQCGFHELDKLENNFKYEFCFSNFGGLNCISSLKEISTGLSSKLKNGAIVTFVIMTPHCPWDWLKAFTFNFKRAARRFSKKGIQSNVEGVSFITYYHTISSIKKSLGKNYTLINQEGLAVISPPPHFSLLKPSNPLIKTLIYLDKYLGKCPPFNSCGDHVILTFKYQSAFFG